MKAADRSLEREIWNLLVPYCTHYDRLEDEEFHHCFRFYFENPTVGPGCPVEIRSNSAKMIWECCRSFQRECIADVNADVNLPRKYQRS